MAPWNGPNQGNQFSVEAHATPCNILNVLVPLEDRLDEEKIGLDVKTVVRLCWKLPHTYVSCWALVCNRAFTVPRLEVVRGGQVWLYFCAYSIVVLLMNDCFTCVMFSFLRTNLESGW